MIHFNGGSPCMVIFSNGSGTGVSSPLEKVSAKGSARLLIQSRLMKASGCRLLFGACGGRKVGMAAQRHENL